ncbi:hydrolase [Bacillus smithii]|uniref:hydrolase n=1 Tax=Bacillus smithii TaxID=1479 RepID=UPI003D196071
MQQKIFQHDREWCIVHYPVKPNGFAVMILGDQNHYVTEKGSFWMENETRRDWIDQLTKSGYLVFYSNFFGAHWGSEKAVESALNLYHYIKRQEIINQRIHILAEGTGALLLKNMLTGIQSNLRCAVVITPCISLRLHNEQERKQKFFLKKFRKEISVAYQVEEKEWEKVIQKDTVIPLIKTKNPLYFIEIIGHPSYKGQLEIVQSVCKERMRNHLPVKLEFFLPEKRPLIIRKCLRYFREHEKEL